MRNSLRALALVSSLALPALADEPAKESEPPADKPTETDDRPKAEEEADDPTPLRLSAVISTAAAAERRGRVVDGVLGILTSGAAIATGAVLFTLPSQTDANKILGGIALAFGGLGVLSSAFGLFSRGSLELLDEAYAPLAADKRIPAEKRLAQGESALAQLAAASKSSRMIGGVTSIILGVGFGIAAAPIALAAIPDTEPNKDQLRLYIGLGLGVSALASIGAGVSQLVIRRTEAERLWSLWLAGTGRPAEARITPFFAPSVAGGVVGVSGAF